MASNFRRKSASSDSNRRASSRPDARRASGRARAPRDGAGDWRAVPGGRYSQQRPQQQGRPLTSVRIGDLDRIERQGRAQRRYNRYLIRVGIIAAVLAVLAIGAAVVYNSSLFTIQNVRVTGVEHLTSEEMSALAAVPSGTTLLRVDAGAIEQNLLRDAWVKSVTVNRVFPNTLQIVITERTVAAADIKTAVRCAGMKKKKSFVQDALAPCDSLDVSALADAAVQRHTSGLTIRKVVVVPGKLVNVVAN